MMQVGVLNCGQTQNISFTIPETKEQKDQTQPSHEERSSVTSLNLWACRSLEVL